MTGEPLPRLNQRPGAAFDVVTRRASTDSEPNRADRFGWAHAHGEDDGRRALAAFVARRAGRRSNRRRTGEDVGAGNTRKADVERIRQAEVSMTVERKLWNRSKKPAPQRIAETAHARRSRVEVSTHRFARGAETDDRRYVFGAGPQPAFVTRSENQRYECRPSLDVESADAFRRVELVPRDGQEVAVELAHVQPHLPDARRRYELARPQHARGR